jgi:hypothetical protein
MIQAAERESLSAGEDIEEKQPNSRMCFVCGLDNPGIAKRADLHAGLPRGYQQKGLHVGDVTVERSPPPLSPPPWRRCTAGYPSRGMVSLPASPQFIDENLQGPEIDLYVLAPFSPGFDRSGPGQSLASFALPLGKPNHR